MAAPMAIFRRLPVVVILGATGTGKSKLAIQIGAKIGGEIISADSMQVYKGLDIITNKVGTEEQQACLHHVIDFLNPLSRYTVVDFRNKALPVIERLLTENKIPVIVGGTNYYIESLLWKTLVAVQHSESDGLLLQTRGDPVDLHIKRRKTASPEHAKNLKEHLKSNGKHWHVSKSTSTEETWAETSGTETEDGKTTPIPNFEEESGTKVSPCVESDGEREGSSSDKVSARTRRTEGNFTASRTECSPSHSWRNPPVLRKDTQGMSTATDQMISLRHQEDSESEVSSLSDQDEWMTVDVEETETEVLFRILTDVDPERAKTLHPSNRRKIIRSLQVYQQLGMTHSDAISAQHKEEGGGPLGGPLRFKDVCIFWIQCDQDVLDKRLDDRVDDMLSRGLLNELSDFHRDYNKHRVEAHADSETLYTQGIFQSIGFKEFHPYLILPEGDKELEKGQNLLQEGVAKLKVATRQYSRRQIKWVKNRFVARPGTNAPAVYAVDSTDPALWEEKVLQPALAILEAMLEGREPPVPPLKHPRIRPSDEVAVRNVCQFCGDRVFVGQQQWLGHLRSKRHHKKSRKMKLASLMKSQGHKKVATPDATSDRREEETEDVDEDAEGT